MAAKYISKRESVKQTQTLLNQYAAAGLEVDGRYGDNTHAAYMAATGFGAEPEDPEPPHEVVREPVTVNFRLKEFACKDGTPVPREYWPNLQRLMERLERLRSALGGHPVTIMSGYRTPDYNASVGGAKNSAHMRATAADIKVKGYSPHDVYATADYIFEEGGVGKYSTFVHCDLDTEVPRPARW